MRTHSALPLTNLSPPIHFPLLRYSLPPRVRGLAILQLYLSPHRHPFYISAVLGALCMLVGAGNLPNSFSFSSSFFFPAMQRHRQGSVHTYTFAGAVDSVRCFLAWRAVGTTFYKHARYSSTRDVWYNSYFFQGGRTDKHNRQDPATVSARWTHTLC
jgi:hypothetical protein